MKTLGIVYYSVCILCICFFQKLSAQDADTTVWINELSITDHHLIGSDADTVPLADIPGSINALTDILHTEAQVYFRSFGPGSSSTVSMFGSRSNEVALIWNGIKVSNPMLGVNDYSMISASDLTSLRIARVGTSTIYGAGSGAGAIILGQEIGHSDKPVSISAGWSSLREVNASASYTDTQGKWKSRTVISGLQGQNNYRYTALSGMEEKLPHAATQYVSASHHSEFHHWPNQKLSLSIWARDHFREIPPTLTESRSEADQSDQFMRSALQYQNIQSRHKLHLKAYYGIQKQIYQNPLINLHATHIFENAQLRMDNQWQPLKQIYVKYGMQNSLFSSRSDNYQGRKQQNRFSAYSQIQYSLHRIPLELILLVQPEWVSGSEPGWTAEMKARYIHSLLGQWTVYFNQNIVWPTLNDLYWSPGGNPELKTEENQITGLIWKKNWVDNFQHTLSVYWKWGENWIQWIPTNLGFWQPFNATEGRSHGINLELSKKLTSYFDLKGGYQYVQTLTLDEPYADKQTIYSPKHMWSIRGHFDLGQRWNLRMIGEYTSTRFVTKDHSQSLDPYFLSHISIAYNFKNHDWTLGLQVRNIFDTDYQGIINRPMPGRHIQLNTQIKF